jgi:two-component system sensor histidine kinase BarA
MPKMLDIPHAIEQAGGNPELARELFTMLLQELPVLKTKLNQAFNNADNESLWNLAHKIHGSTSYCGVPQLQQATIELETTIKTQASDIADKIQKVNQAIDELLAGGQALLEQEWS